MNQSMRCFIAIPLSAQVRQNLAEFCQQHGLDKRSSWLRPVNPANIHITLKFLGEVDPLIIPSLKKTFDEVASQLTPFSIEIRGVGAYPNWKNHPRVLWVGAYPVPPLEKVFTKIDAATLKMGFTSENRRFSPHLTLARVSAQDQSNVYQPLLENLSNLSIQPHFGEMVVESFAFYKSTLQPGGPVYTILSTHQFVQ